MISRILLDDDDFMLRFSLFGGLRATLKNGSYTVKANRYEKQHLFRTIDILESRGVELSPSNKNLQELFRLYAESLLGRGDARWQAYFKHLTPEQIADSFQV